jgi:acyl-CoA synthetase (AMP-forming)/AMP-acid ligase II
MFLNRLLAKQPSTRFLHRVSTKRTERNLASWLAPAPASTSSAASAKKHNFVVSADVAERCHENVVYSPYAPIPVGPYPPLFEFVTQKWGTIAEADAKLSIIDGSTGLQRTLGDHCRLISGLTQTLQVDMNVNEGDTVAFLCPNHVDYLPVILSISVCGAKVTPVNPMYSAQELGKVLARSSSNVLVVHTSCVPVALEAIKSCSTVKHMIVITDNDDTTGTAINTGSTVNLPVGAIDLASLRRVKGVGDDTEFRYWHSTVREIHGNTSEHPVVLPYSSGTSGAPKGVQLSHSNLVSNLLQLEIAECIKTSFLPHHSLVTPLPFFHMYAFTAAMLHTGYSGHTLITMSQRFDLEKFCQLVQTHRPERAHLVPPIVIGLAKSPVVDKYDMSSLQICWSAAAPLGSELENAVALRIGCRVKQAWGTPPLLSCSALVLTAVLN